MPRLLVENIGPISFPLAAEQFGQLLFIAEQAPYGRGGETLVDMEVRNTRQTPPERVRIEGHHWTETLNNILLQSAEGLGVKGPVSADFYKLLGYDTGGFFLDPRDTEKVPGMFATLVIDLSFFLNSVRKRSSKILKRWRNRSTRRRETRGHVSRGATETLYWFSGLWIESWPSSIGQVWRSDFRSSTSFSPTGKILKQDRPSSLYGSRQTNFPLS
ncbi:MAG: hypothetical protein ACYCYP_07285 [Leptospirales bacterium]